MIRVQAGRVPVAFLGAYGCCFLSSLCLDLSFALKTEKMSKHWVAVHQAALQTLLP